MAEKKNPEQEEQHRFPVLTVLKNNAILKNIVLDDHNEDQMVLIGRHPNCNIVLTHPSVSRFHLRIRSNPSSRTLSLVDLASGNFLVIFFFYRQMLIIGLLVFC